MKVSFTENRVGSQIDNAKLNNIYFLIIFSIESKYESSKGNGIFSEPELCERDMRTSDIVPIIVGACLAGLVIIVLIAYLVGRARAKRQGYASV